MSVEYLDTPSFHGYRVRRQIDNRSYQEYFSLKRDGRRMHGAARARIRQVAEARDAELEQSQRETRERAARAVHLDARGRVRGIVYRRKRERSGRVTPLLQVSVHSTLEDRLVNTTVSIWSHGFNEAWRRATAFYARHNAIPESWSTYRGLRASQPAYADLPARYGPLRAQAVRAKAAASAALAVELEPASLIGQPPRPPLRAEAKPRAQSRASER